MIKYDYEHSIGRFIIEKYYLGNFKLSVDRHKFNKSVLDACKFLNGFARKIHHFFSEHTVFFI